MKRKSSYLIGVWLLLVSLIPVHAQPSKPVIQTGLEVADEQNFAFLKGKRIGLITNQTAVTSDLFSIIDILYNAENVNLVALFGPEHGVRGTADAGEKVDSGTDAYTGLPVYSLYGSQKKPTPSMLEDIDVLVYDIQDIGTRSYTFISTLGATMEAAAEHQIEYIIFDRPNPLGGKRMEGAIAREEFLSFVSPFPVPYVYGLTPGELAGLLIGEQMIDVPSDFTVDVVEMNGWKRTMSFKDTGLPWIPTSPHIPHQDSPLYYVCSGVMGELGIISEGVGTTIPFQFLGHPDVDAVRLAQDLNARNMSGVRFRAASMKPYYGRDKGRSLHGVQPVIMNADSVSLLDIQFHVMDLMHQQNPDIRPLHDAAKPRVRMFNLVLGTDQIGAVFKENYRYDDIEHIIHEGVNRFRSIAESYMIYPMK